MEKNMKKLTVLLALLLLLSGCSPYPMEERSLSTREAECRFQIYYGKNREEIADALEKMLLDLDDRWAANYINSVPSQMNDKGTVLYLEDMEFLDQLEALRERTDGAFDPMLHSVYALWGFVDGQYRVPSEEELKTALEEEKWNISAALQGYMSRRALQMLKSMGVEQAILYLGNCVQTVGLYKGKPWVIYIDNHTGGKSVGYVEVQADMTVATAGEYQRCFEQDGKRYHNILDPKTGMPAESGLRSVTVISSDGVVADVLSTALFVMGLGKATELWRQSDDFEAVFVLSDGSVWATEGANFSGGDFETIHRER
jgi:thiamine biosynthesis lipoprotein